MRKVAYLYLLLNQQYNDITYLNLFLYNHLTTDQCIGTCYLFFHFYKNAFTKAHIYSMVNATKQNFLNKSYKMANIIRFFGPFLDQLKYFFPKFIRSIA
jgi:hypothetical protein